MVKITGKYICDSKKLNLFIFTHAHQAKLSHKFLSLPPGRRKLPITSKQLFLKIFFSLAEKGERIMELKNYQN